MDYRSNRQGEYSSGISFARDVIPTIPDQELKITPQTIENLKAIVNPQQAIADRQASQVAGVVGDLVAEKLNPELNKAALRDIENLRVESEKMLKGNTGSKRLAFTPEQKVKLNQLRSNIKNNIEYGQYLTKRYGTATDELLRGIGNGTYDEADKDVLKNWDLKTMEHLQKGGSIETLTDPYSDLITAKSQKSKEVNTIEAQRRVSFLNKGQSPYNSWSGDKFDEIFEKSSQMYPSIYTPDNYEDYKVIAEKQHYIKPPPASVSGSNAPQKLTWGKDNKVNVSTYGQSYSDVIDGIPVMGKIQTVNRDGTMDVLMEEVVPELAGSGLLKKPTGKMVKSGTFKIKTVPYDGSVGQNLLKENKAILPDDIGGENTQKEKPKTEPKDKTKNPNYKGYDENTVKDKTGKTRKIVWDNAKGNYVYAD